MLPIDGPCPDRDERMPRVYRRFACEGKTGRHVLAHEGDPIMPHFNLFGLSSQRRRIKMISSKISLLGIARCVASERDIYDGMPTLKLLSGGVSFRNQCGWAPCHLESLGILFL